MHARLQMDWQAKKVRLHTVQRAHRRAGPASSGVLIPTASASVHGHPAGLDPEPLKDEPTGHDG